MIKPITKYFSVLLIIFLVNSNFSFAVTQMICGMSKVKNVCECRSETGKDKMTLTQSESECCKIKIRVITNSNTLEKNQSKIINLYPVYQYLTLLPVFEITKPNTHSSINSDFPVPITDIPVFISSLLI
ncbi:MAG: hypothetical protein JSS91_08095 [Bacteroidetes bacterium]|nr:hypothetical protein [Bacteroidota bacterium]